MNQDGSHESLELLYHISRELASSLDLHQVLSQVLFLSTRNVGAERGSLIVLDEHEAPVEAAIVYQDRLIPHTVHQLAAILDQGLAGWVLHTRQAALIPDTSKDERWMKRPDDEAANTGAKSAICIPILMGGEQLVGVITLVHPTPGFFTTDHLHLLQAIADQSGIAMYNARLVDSLRVSNLRYRELFDDSIDPILITDWKGQIMEANRRALLLMASGEADLSAHSIFELQDARVGWLTERADELHSGRTISYETLLTTFEKNELPVEVHVRKVDIEGGDYLQWILRDITERKTLDALRNDLMGMIYHDMRSPLSNVISSLGILQDMITESSDEQMHLVVDVASRASNRLQRLISSLVDVGRLEAGQPVIHTEQMDARAVLEEVVEVLHTTADNRQQVLTAQVESSLPPIQADVDMMKRVLINLTENALKYSPQGAQVTLGSEKTADGLRFWVEDTGPGIPPEDREHVFDKYVRLNREKKGRSAGLGLAFCRLAVAAHGGKIWVESGSEGGSRFVFTLPGSSAAGGGTFQQGI